MGSEVSENVTPQLENPMFNSNEHLNNMKSVVFFCLHISLGLVVRNWTQIDLAYIMEHRYKTLLPDKQSYYLKSLNICQMCLVLRQNILLEKKKRKAVPLGLCVKGAWKTYEIQFFLSLCSVSTDVCLL